MLADQLSTTRQSETLLRTQVFGALQQMGLERNFGAACWGSLARDEITPTSDIDLICCCSGTSTSVSAEDINRSIATAIDSPRRVDAIVCSSAKLQDDFVYSTGTNFHSVYFATEFLGESQGIGHLRYAQHKLHEDTFLRVRELFNCFSSALGLAQILTEQDPLWAKLSSSGTNKWVRLAMAAQMRWPDLVNAPTGEVLRYIEARCNTRLNVLSSWESILEWRRAYEKAHQAFERLPPPPDHHDTYRSIVAAFFKEIAPWIQNNEAGTGVPATLLYRFIKKISGEECDIPPPRIVHPELDNFLRAFCSEDSQELSSLANLKTPLWWLATTLVTNSHTPPDSLEMLAFPVFDVEPTVWQTVRLYVAKSAMTSSETLRKILDFPGLREQDYDSARKNLRNRAS